MAAASRMSHSYHEKRNAGVDWADRFDSSSVDERAPLRSASSCMNPLFLLGWMRRKLAYSFGCKSRQAFSRIAACESRVNETFRAHRSGSKDSVCVEQLLDEPAYCQVLFANQNAAHEDVIEIEPVYEDCSLSFREMALAPRTYRFESQLSDASRTSGVFSLSDDLSERPPSTPTHTDEQLENCDDNAIYSTVLRCRSEHPPALPKERHYQRSEVESLIKTGEEIEMKDADEQMDKLKPLPVSDSVSSLRSQGRFSLWKKKLLQELDDLHFIDSPSESVPSLDTRSNRFHCFVNPLSRLSNCHTLLADSSTSSNATQNSIFAVL